MYGRGDPARTLRALKEVVFMKIKIEEPWLIKELYVNRTQHYEETKHMTRAEIIEKYNLKFENIEKQ
jgi:hypothetical protein